MAFRVFLDVRTSAVVTYLDRDPGKQLHTRATRSSCRKPNGRKRFKRGQNSLLDGELVQVDLVRPMYRNRQPVYLLSRQTRTEDGTTASILLLL